MSHYLFLLCVIIIIVVLAFIWLESIFLHNVQQEIRTSELSPKTLIDVQIKLFVTFPPQLSSNLMSRYNCRKIIEIRLSFSCQVSGIPFNQWYSECQQITYFEVIRAFNERETRLLCQLVPIVLTIHLATCSKWIRFYVKI